MMHKRGAWACVRRSKRAMHHGHVVHELWVGGQQVQPHDHLLRVSLCCCTHLLAKLHCRDTHDNGGCLASSDLCARGLSLRRLEFL